MSKKLLVLCLAIPFFIFGCGHKAKNGNVSNVKNHEVKSEIYTEEEISDAIENIKDYFMVEFKDCTLNELYYIGDEENEKEQQYRNDNEYEYIVLISSFYVDKSNNEGSLNTDYTYTDWKWILSRRNGGEWSHLDHGYC